jgi:hypothetical protein
MHQYGINMGSTQPKIGSCKNGRDKPSLVSILFLDFYVNSKTNISNLENGTGRDEILLVCFQP